MATKRVKPTSPGRRFQTYATFEEITQTTPEKSLLKNLRKSGGRNANGRITSRHRGGGHKRHYRIIDFKRDKIGIPAKVATIEYDPNRSARIALLNYVDGEKRYILAASYGRPCHRTQVSSCTPRHKPMKTSPRASKPLVRHRVGSESIRAYPRVGKRTFSKSF